MSTSGQQYNWDYQRARLRSRIEACLHAPDSPPINLSIPKHGVIAPVLRSLAYDEKYSGKSVPIVFRDGSRPAPFPIGVLSLVEEAPPREELPIIRLGLISFRHPDMDYLVDLYLVANKHIDRHSSGAEIEQYAFHVTVETLGDMQVAEGAAILVYHTGLEPAVIGFYRGVVEVLRARINKGVPRRLVVVPCLFEGEKTAKSITASCAGAKANSFVECEPWW